MFIFADMTDKALVRFPFFAKYSSQKTCCTHPLRRRRGGTRRNDLFRVPTLTLWMWNVQVQFFFYMQIYLISHRSVRSRHSLALSTSAPEVSVQFWCQCCNWLSCLVFSRLLQDHNSVQPRSDSRAVCWLFNSPVSAHWRQSTSHRGSVLTYKIPV